jgi:DNA primase
MNRAIPEEIIEEIKLRVDIVELINSYIPLKKSGSDTWKALCPFHNEKTPSFSISQKRQHFHCFGCGKSGNVFSFVMEREAVDFPNAAYILAGKYNIIIPEKKYSSAEERHQEKIKSDSRERLYQVNEEFASWYASLLKVESNSAVARYLLQRAIPNEIRDKFRIGAAPDSWDASLKYGLSRGYTELELLEAGILLRSEQGKIYDRFRNRLIFPIWNEQGRVVGFSARTIEVDPTTAKYVNSPETHLFKKGNILYALCLAREDIRKKDYVILCEGQLDVIAMHRAGYCNAVAPQGTAFTFEQAMMLKRYSTKIYIFFDSDNAGINATLRALEILLPLDFEIKVISTPSGKDPDEIYKEKGEDGIAEVVNNATDFFDFTILQLKQKNDVKTPSGKAKICQETIKYLEILNNPVIKEAYVRKLSEFLNISCDGIYKDIARLKKKIYPVAANIEVDGASSAANNVDNLPSSVIHAEETLLELAISNEHVCASLAGVLPSDFISETGVGRILNMIIGLHINGEWGNVTNAVNDVLSINPDHKVSRILISGSSYATETINKAVCECVGEIKRYYMEKSKLEFRQRLSAAVSPEDKSQIIHDYQNALHQFYGTDNKIN